MIYMFLSNNPSSGDINWLNLSCCFLFQSECLKEAFNELDMTSDVLQFLMSPDAPHFRLSTFGNAGSTHVSKQAFSWAATRENLSSGFSDKVRFKPACSATETSWKVEISLVSSLDGILSKKGKTRELIRLRGCAGWSAPLLLATLRRHVFSRRGLVKSVYQKNNFLISQPKHMLWVLKRTVSMRRFF